MPDRSRRLLAAVAVAAALSGCRRAEHPAPPGPAVVQVARARVGGGQSNLEATGTLRRSREMTLAFRTPGVVTRLLVDDGDTVRAGQVIAEIDGAVAAARYRQAQADLALAEAESRRETDLADQDAATRQQAEVAAGRLAAARTALVAAGYDRRWTRLTAPAPGVILARAAQVGEVVQPGQPVVAMADLRSALVVRAAVADRDAARLRLGAPAQVLLAALPGIVLAGRVSRIAQRADGASGGVAFEVTLPDRPGLRSGLIASVRLPFEGGPTARYARVPAEAVLEADRSQAYVMRYDPAPGVARRIAVRFAGFEGDDALLTGLAADAQVITAGAGFVADGQRVTVAADVAARR